MIKVNHVRYGPQGIYVILLNKPYCARTRSESVRYWQHWVNTGPVLAHCGMFRDDVIKRKHFSRYWPLVRGIHRSPVNSPHKGQWRGALMFSLICARINGWVNNGETGDLRRHRAHYDVIVTWKGERYPVCPYQRRNMNSKKQVVNKCLC